MEPYKGLRPYEEQDQNNFFGRDKEKNILIDKILSSKLTLLFAASGVGKSSLLQAAVLPELKNPEVQNLDVVYFKDWVDEPGAALKNAVLGYLQQQRKINTDYRLEPELSLKDAFHRCSLGSSDPLVIVLDQFEEFFNYQRYRSEFKPFIRQLAAAIHDRETATAFVISMREDFALELNAFKPNLSTVLFENFYRLEKLPLEKAKTAIAAPVEHVGFHYEEGLLENLLADLIRREQTDRFGANAAELMNAPSVVEPPHLQIICTQLWEADRNNPHKCLSKATYESKGKAAGLLTNYFKNQVETLSAAEKKLASESFNYLVNKHGTKMAYPLEDLAQLLRADKTALQITLDKLEQARILRRQIRQTNALHLQEKGQDRILWYELYHDIFSKSIYDWNEAYKARQRNKKAAFAVAGVFMGAAVLYTGYDIWVNHYDHHLRLSIKSHVSTGIELYQGKKASLDVLNQQHYLGETDYRRTDLEPDKLFQKAQVENIEKINPEVIGLFPRVERIMGYWEDGEIDKALKLARYTIRGRNRETAAKMITLLARQPSMKALEELGWHLERSQDVHLKKQIIETISLYVPHQAIPFLLLAAKDEHKEVHASAFSALGSLENREALAPLIAFLENPNASMRTNAAKALGQLGYPEAVEPLLPLLENQNSDTRHQAAFALAKLGSTAAVTPFFAMLKDSDAKIRRNTVNAIAQAKFDSSEIVTALVILLKDSEPRVGQAAIDALVQLDTVEALSPLVEMLREPDSNVRESAVRVLIQTNRAEAVKPLLALLEDANLKIRDRAVDVLAQLGRSEAVTPLLERLKNPDSEVRGKAVSKLAELDAVESITSLTALLKDPSAEVRLATVDALGLLGRVEAVEPLMEILNDPYWKVRHNAIAALGKLHGSKAAGLLIRALDDHNGQVRAIAAQALGNMRNVTAAESLLKRLKDTNSKVRKNAAAALVKLGRIKNAKQDSLVRGDAENVRKRPNHSKFVKPPAIVEALVMQLKDRELYARGQVAEALAQLGSDDALKPLITELLIEQVKDKTPYVRQNAAYALSLLKSVKAAGKLIEPPLIELLKDEDPDIREKAVGALGELGSAGAVKFLIKRLKDKDADVRKVAAVMLGKAGNTEAVKPLIELLKDSYFDVVASARTAIVQLNDDNTVKLLTELLKDPDGFVRYDAASALGELNSAKAAKPLVDLLEDYSWSVRNKASSALEKLGGNETLRPLIEKLLIASLENQNSDTRSSAANLLGQLGSEKAIGPLRKLLKDQYSSVRSNAAASLDILGSHRAVQPFVITLQDQDKNIRIRAVKVLTQLNSAEGIGPLIKLLTEMIPADGGNDFFEGASAFHRLYKSKVIQDTRLVGNLMSKWTGITEIFQLRELYKMSLLLARLGYKEKTVRFSLRKLPSSTLLGDWEWRWTSTSVLMEFVNLLANSSHIEEVQQYIKSFIESCSNSNTYVWNPAQRTMLLMFLDSAALPNYMVELIKDEKQPLYFRSDVAESLSELDSVGIVNYLVEQLNHPNRKIRSDATSILVRLGRIEAFKPLLEFLRDSDPNMRGKAASALGKSGNLEAVKPLIKLLRDSDSEVRSSAASALGELGSVKAVKPLIELLKDLKQNVRGAAVLALGELDTVEAIKPLIELRNDLDSNVRKNAASALGILDTIEVFTPLIELLSDPKAPVRSSAASALGELSIVGAEKSLIRLLGDNEKITSDEEDKSTVRDKATEALIALGSVGSVKPLLRQLKNKDSEVRDSAMEELRKFGIVPLDQLDEKVRFNELKKLKEKSAGKKSKERREAAKKLGEILSEASVQQLIKILGDTNRRVKTQAVKSLTRIARIQADLALPARPHLERLLEDPESRVREAAKRALDTLSHAAPGNVAAAKLKELALDKQERLAIRSSAIKLLGNLETEDSSEILITAFQQEEAEQGENELSFIVWQALGNLGSVDALPFLLEQLDELDRRKREWRKLRDQDSQNSDEPEDFSGDPQNFDEEDDTQPWYDGYLETELSYAIAKIDPTNEGLKLLHHNLANVRKGAWYGLAKEADAALVQRLVEDYQGLQHLGGLNPIFRHAVYRAMDKSLITVEVRGNTRDLDVLKILAKKLDKEGAVYDRTEWTIKQLEYRLKLEEEPA